MRSPLKSPGVPSTREAGNASLIGGASNRPMSAGSTDNSFLVTTAPPDFSSLQYQLVGILHMARNGDYYMKLVSHSLHDPNTVLGERLRLILESRRLSPLKHTYKYGVGISVQIVSEA